MSCRRGVLVLGAVGMLLLSGCSVAGRGHDANADRTGGSAPVAGPHDDPSERPVAPREWDRVLRLLGAHRVYVMAGDEVLRAGLGVIGPEGLRPAPRNLQPVALSNIAGNGARVVIGGVGDESDPYTDGVYEVADHGLLQVARAGSGLYAPGVGPDGSLSAVRPRAGAFVLDGQSGRWSHLPASGRLTLSGVAMSAAGQGFSVIHVNSPGSTLVTFLPDGRRRNLASIPCMNLVLLSPDGQSLATTLPASTRKRCGAAQVLTTDGATVAEVPDGWQPLAWGEDSHHLLVTRSRSLAVLDVRSGGLTDPIPLGTRVWMAAPVRGPSS